MTKIHEDPHWQIDQTANLLHLEGLGRAVTDDDYTAALNAFDSAEFHLSQLDQTPDVLLQTARVLRDDGFTDTRQIISVFNDNKAAPIHPARESQLEHSRRITEELLPSYAKPRTAREEELFSEHGATLSLLGRAVVAEQVLSRNLPSTPDSPFTVENLRSEQYYFGKAYAHGYLKQGSNMYYLVSNAMHGARAERVNGKPAHIAPWLGRAAVCLARASISDRRNVGHALKTVIRIGFSMRSKKAACASILSRP